MKIFLAGTGSASKNIEIVKKSEYILESFYYIKEWQIPLIKNCKMFLLDSGAFTFMNNSKKGKTDWKDYIDRYIAFINKHDIKYFFELDIDCIVGYDNVLKIRKYIEEKTGKKCIPVWHHNRGKEEFIKMCKEYDYVSIGGLVAGGGEYSKKHWKFFSWFISTAHKYGAKIHALGFTSLDGIQKYRFDSVDSTTWLNGERFGEIHLFKNGTIEKYAGVKKGKRVKRNVGANEHNFIEWAKFQRYADKNL